MAMVQQLAEGDYSEFLQLVYQHLLKVRRDLEMRLLSSLTWMYPT